SWRHLSPCLPVPANGPAFVTGLVEFLSEFRQPPRADPPCTPSAALEYGASGSNDTFPRRRNPSMMFSLNASLIEAQGSRKDFHFVPERFQQPNRPFLYPLWMAYPVRHTADLRADIRAR